MTDSIAVKLVDYKEPMRTERQNLFITDEVTPALDEPKSRVNMVRLPSLSNTRSSNLFNNDQTGLYINKSEHTHIANYITLNINEGTHETMQ